MVIEEQKDTLESIESSLEKQEKKIKENSVAESDMDEEEEDK